MELVAKQTQTATDAQVCAGGRWMWGLRFKGAFQQ